MLTFKQELAALLNRHNLDTFCSTPDYMLAEYLEQCLITHRWLAKTRDKWFGFTHPLTDEKPECDRGCDRQGGEEYLMSDSKPMSHEDAIEGHVGDIVGATECITYEYKKLKSDLAESVKLLEEAHEDAWNDSEEAMALRGRIGAFLKRMERRVASQTFD